MTEAFILPDQPHIEHIKKHLWAGREFGKAAVMVGAGFSRNAEKVAPTSRGFAVWDDLAADMYNALYPPDRDPQKQKLKLKQAISGGGALSLARQYELAFGRNALDDLIRQGVPDQEYRPGLLHQLLLALPWSDIFTTNYDTLLERARPAVHTRKYDTVIVEADIPCCLKPRIVKLHGSFPSHRPFIITDEDYRAYPRLFSPFVNMVQQAIMENVLCLVGFSGDDPNFLQWLGWVRDNLGTSAPPVYLCGLFDFPLSYRRLLESRNVIIVDLSPKFPKSAYSNPSQRHREALGWFLSELMNGAPTDIRNWPSLTPGITWRPPQECDEIKLLPPSLPDLLGEVLPGDDPKWPEQRALWERCRRAYPGWVVAPKENRESLWTLTQNWILPAVEASADLAPDLAVCLLFELAWRVDTAGMPLIPQLAEAGRKALARVNPFPGAVALEGALLPDQFDEQLRRQYVEQAWVELLFMLARYARDMQEEELFGTIMAQLKLVLGHCHEWMFQWHYEWALFHLYRCDHNKARAVLRQCPQLPNLPLWELRRAGLLAELGEHEQALNLGEATLADVRSRLSQNRGDYFLLSLEGWAMFLLRRLEAGTRTLHQATINNSRREELRAYRCDPEIEMELLEQQVAQTPPADRSFYIRRDPGFDPNTETVSHHWSSLPRVFDFRSSFTLLRIFDKTGLPFRLGLGALSWPFIGPAAEWIARSYPRWAAAVLMRARAEKSLETWLSRAQVARLDSAMTELLVTIGSTLLDHWSAEGGTRSRPMQDPRFRVATEVLSRIAFRMKPTALNWLLETTLELYSQEISRPHGFPDPNFNNLIRRVLFTLPPEAIERYMPALLSLPFPSRPEHTDRWVEPLDHLRWWPGQQYGQAPPPTWEPAIAQLIEVVRSGKPEARRRAAVRLATLHVAAALTQAQQEHFATALYSRLDPATQLPDLLDTPRFFLLRLPSPDRDALLARFRQYLHTGNALALYREWRGPENITWSTEDAVVLLHQLTQIVTSHASGEVDPLDAILDDSPGLKHTSPLMARVVLPHLRHASPADQAMARALLEQLNALGIVTLDAAPMLLFIAPDESEVVANQLRQGLRSNQDDVVEASLAGIYYWMVNHPSLPPIDNDLVQELLNWVVNRRNPGLDQALDAVARLAGAFPTLVSSFQQNAIYSGLDHLAHETELPAGSESGAEPGPIPVVERPRIRVLAAKLAAHLHVHISARGESVPKVLAHWKEITETDTLPEVRRAWNPEFA